MSPSESTTRGRLGPVPVPAPLRALVAHLPIGPPSLLLAWLLDRLLRPQLSDEAAQQLAGQTVEIEVRDLGIRCRLMLSASGFRAVRDGGPVTLRVAADSLSYLRLLRGEEDADRLFFERALIMEGDTEYGLTLKNTLDALEPPLKRPGLR
ncbi:MAG: SCP2 domain-containing protein [Burkholderiaceae bacterium]